MIEDEVIELVRRVRPLGKGPIQIVPATEEELRRFEHIHGLRLPAELTSWLRRCNGASVNPGGFYSLFPKEKMGSLDWHLRSFPDWRSRGWFPIAGDGCGNVYIMASKLTTPSTGTHPICFLDQSDFERLRYAVASGLWKFLYLCLESEILHDQGEEEYWPFNKKAVLAVDPALAECKDVPFLWELDAE